MIEQDYILRLLNQFFDSLNKLLNNKNSNTIEEIDKRIKSLYMEYFKKDYLFYHNNSIDIIMETIIDSNNTQNTIARCEMLAELFYNEAELTANENQKNNLFNKALILLKYVNINSKTFSEDRLMKIKTIEHSLQV